MNDFRDSLLLINNRWAWRADDVNFQTFKALSAETELLKLITPFLRGREIMVQAGGHCGMQVEKFALHFETVYTFEPDPRNFYCLSSNLPYGNVVKIQGCLGDAPGFVSLMQPLDDIGSGCIAPGSKTGRFPVFTIDGLGLQSCDFIQLDLEGYEFFALKGAVETIKKFLPVLCLEFYWMERFGVTGPQIEQFLSELGYEYRGNYGTDRVYTPAEKLVTKN
jgi:FkbM family methyltransferase